jgi:alpha-glucosidase
MAVFLVSLASPLASAQAAAGEFDPVATPESVVVSGRARFTVLTPSLVRLEWSPTAAFEDRASLAFVHRKLPTPRFSREAVDGWLTISTDAFTLRYREGSGRFTSENLTVQIHAGQMDTMWTPASKPVGNLRGTMRTLDGVSGPTDLELGLLSRDGWTLIDDSQRVLFDGSDWPWATPRAESDAQDWYLFAYGREYYRPLRDFQQTAGPIPLPPRYVFGAWWSRYWPYSDPEFRELVAEFRRHEVPLDVLVVDMDWHLDGWTGYTWNPKYFPDPEGFLKWTKSQGLRVPLNLHPAEGVGRHERAFADMAEALGLDPETTERIPFDCTDRRFIEAYFKFLHHPLERQGVDFWWMDWQQGTKSDIEGLDPLFWLNYLHWTDWQRNHSPKDERPLIFSRWGGLGNHRYQIGFSGDTFCNWPSLAFQPYFTATAGNVGYAYWSHDIGGHQPGPVDPELYARWIQWGALSPILRTHTTRNPAAERRIWAFDAETFRVAREAWQLRYALLPYIYSNARSAYDSGLPLCRPMYYEWPDYEEAYQNPGQYLFGGDLLVAPVTAPRDATTGLTPWKVWLPPGGWTNWYTGRSHTGPGELRMLVPLDEVPLFVRSSAVIPMAPPMQHTGEKAVDPLILQVFAGGRSEFVLYEDDGLSRDYERGRFARTPIIAQRGLTPPPMIIATSPTVYRGVDSMTTVTIGPVQGEYEGMPPERTFEVRLRDTTPARIVFLGSEVLPQVEPGSDAGWWYDPSDFTLVIRTPRWKVIEQVEMTIYLLGDTARRSLLMHGARGVAGMLDDAQAEFGAAAPAELRQVLGALRAIGLEENWTVEQLTALRAQAVALPFSIAKSAIPEPRRTELVSRLLGVATRPTLEVGSGGSLAGIVEITLAPMLGGRHAFAGAAELLAPANWKSGEQGRSAEGRPGADEVVTLRRPLERDGAAQPLTLTGRAMLKLNEQIIEFPFEKTLLPSINAWWVVGPFDAPESKGLTTVYPPEKSIDLAATYPGKDDAAIAWRKVERPLTAGADFGAEFFVNFADVFGRRHYDAVAYAVAYLHAPEDMDVTLAMGSDDGAVVWLNGREVHRVAVGRAYQARQDKVALRLSAGVNTLLLKIDQHGGDWGFGASLENAGGKPVTNVRALLTP